MSQNRRDMHNLNCTVEKPMQTVEPTISVIVHIATQHGKPAGMYAYLPERYEDIGARLKLRSFIRRMTGYSYDALRAAEPRTPT